MSGPPIASSIHTIHRPIARSRKLESPTSSKGTNGKGKKAALYAPIPSSDEEGGDVSDEDEDFEVTPIVPTEVHRLDGETRSIKNASSTSPSEKMDKLIHIRRSHMTRSASLATVRMQRRTMLAEKLKDVFGLSDISEVVAGITSFPIGHAYFSDIFIRTPVLASSFCS